MAIETSVNISEKCQSIINFLSTGDNNHCITGLKWSFNQCCTEGSCGCCLSRQLLQRFSILGHRISHLSRVCFPDESITLEENCGSCRYQSSCRKGLFMKGLQQRQPFRMVDEVMWSLYRALSDHTCYAFLLVSYKHAIKTMSYSGLKPARGICEAFNWLVLFCGCFYWLPHRLHWLQF
jgi:hypothetical protein